MPTLKCSLINDLWVKKETKLDDFNLAVERVKRLKKELEEAGMSDIDRRIKRSSEYRSMTRKANELEAFLTDIERRYGISPPWILDALKVVCETGVEEVTF